MQLQIMLARRNITLEQALFPGSLLPAGRQNDHSMRGHAFFSFKFWNTKTPFGDWSTFRKSRALCLYYYDDRKERLLYLFLHILFLLDAFGAYLEVIFLQQIVFFIIAIFNAALKVCIVNIFIQLLYVWMALVSSWLVAQVNFMTVLGENIPRMFSEETDSRRSWICEQLCWLHHVHWTVRVTIGT